MGEVAARRRSDRVGVLPQAADSKREQFRRYLEKSGVLDTLTKGKSPARVVTPEGLVAVLRAYLWGETTATRSPRGALLPQRSRRPGTAAMGLPFGLPRRPPPAARLAPAGRSASSVCLAAGRRTLPENFVGRSKWSVSWTARRVALEEDGEALWKRGLSIAARELSPGSLRAPRAWGGC